MVKFRGRPGERPAATDPVRGGVQQPDGPANRHCVICVVCHRYLELTCSVLPRIRRSCADFASLKAPPGQRLLRSEPCRSRRTPFFAAPSPTTLLRASAAVRTYRRYRAATPPRPLGQAGSVACRVNPTCTLYRDDPGVLGGRARLQYAPAAERCGLTCELSIGTSAGGPLARQSLECGATGELSPPTAHQIHLHRLQAIAEWKAMAGTMVLIKSPRRNTFRVSETKLR